MESNKSVNKVSLFIKIWLVHIVVYYTVYVTVIRIFKSDYEEFYLVLLGFVGGIMGICEQIPYFILLPILTMAILINSYLRNDWFTAYLISTGVCYSIDYIWLLTQKKHDKLLTTIDVNLLYIMIPSLLLAVLGNWLLLKNSNNLIN